MDFSAPTCSINSKITFKSDFFNNLSLLEGKNALAQVEYDQIYS